MRKMKKVFSLVIAFIMVLTIIAPGLQMSVEAAERDETKRFLESGQEFVGNSAKMIAKKADGDDMSFYADQMTATWSARFKTTSTGLMSVMGLADAADGTNYISLYLMSGNKIGVEIKKGTENAHYSKVIPTANLANGFNDGQWHTLTLLVTENSYIFYIDGLKWTVAQPANMIFAQNRGIGIDNFSIGGLERGPMAGTKNNYYFNGTIKDVRVSNYAWSEADILAMHREPIESGDEQGNTTESNIDDTSRDIKIQSVSSPNEHAPDVANNAIDNNQSTVWHTNWYPTDTNRDDHYITMDLGEVCEVTGLRYLPRKANTGTNGNITQYKIQFSEDGINWSDTVVGNWTSTYSWKNTSFSLKQARYVRLYSINSLSNTGKPLTSAAEIRITGVAPVFVKPMLSKTKALNLLAGEKVSNILLNSLAPEGEYTYSLVDGEGATDNSKFEIDGNILKIKENLTKGEGYSIRIRAVHNGHETEEGHSGEATFTIRAAGDGLVMEIDEEKTIVPGAPVNLSNEDNADVIKEMDEGTIVVQYTSTSDDLIQSLFSVSNSTAGNQNRHFHMYVQPNETFGSEIRNDSSFSYGSIKVPNAIRRMYNKNYAKNTVAFKADKENGVYKLFVNGRLANTVDANTLSEGYKFISDITGIDSIMLGSTMRAGVAAYNFGGTIHNAKIYEIALSDEEIIAMTNETNYSGKDQIFSSVDGLDCGYYRIPSLLTLSDGTVVSAIDARFGGTHDSPNNIDIAFSKSKDGGKTWSKPTTPLHFDDFADTMIDLPAGLQVRNQQSASFIDPVMFEDEEIGRLFLVADAFVAGAGSPQAQVGSGFKEINGKKYLRLKKAGESSYNYTIRENNVIWDDNTNTATDYSVNNNFEILHNGEVLTVKQKDVEVVNNSFVYKTTDKDVKMSIFYADAAFQVYNTAYIYMKYSDDQGETWSDPVILNSMIKSEDIRLMIVGPGRGIQLKNGEHKGRLILPLYQSQGCDLAYSDDHGETWNYVDGPTGGISNNMSESQIVEMPDGSLKVFARAGNKIGTATSLDGGKTWSEGVAVPGISAPGVGSQISVINYDGLIDGKEAIILSTPTGTVRRGGQIKIGLITDTGLEGIDRYRIDWTYSMKVHGESVAYGYSCLTQLPNNNIGVIFEKYDSYTGTELHGRDVMIYEEYSLSELRGSESVTIVAKADGQGTVSKSNNVIKGTEVTVKATPENGYEFKGWQNDAGEIISTDATYTFVANEDCTLTAVFKVSVDKRLLQALIEMVEGMNSDHYTVESWEKVETTLVIAKELLINEDVSQEEINRIKNELQKAIDSLVEIEEGESNKVILGIAIDVANKVTQEQLDKLVPAVVEEFKAALANAEKIFAKADASQTEVNEAFDRLAKVMHMLEFFKGDKTSLKAFIDQVNGLVSSEYTEATWNVLQTVLVEVNKVYTDENAMQKEVDEAYTKLVKAFIELRLIPNKDALKELIGKVESLDAAKYSAESWNVVQNALTKARAVLENKEATKEEVDNANNALTKALSGLVELPGTSEAVKPSTNGGKEAAKTGDNVIVLPIALLTITGFAGIWLSRKKKFD